MLLAALAKPCLRQGILIVRRDESGGSHFQDLREFPEGHNGGIPSTPFKIAQVLLRKS